MSEYGSEYEGESDPLADEREYTILGEIGLRWGMISLGLLCFSPLFILGKAYGDSLIFEILGYMVMYSPPLWLLYMLLTGYWWFQQPD